MEGTRHPCAWPGCVELVVTDHFTCPGHWRRIPEPTKRRLNLAWDKRKHARTAVMRAVISDVSSSQLRVLQNEYRQAAAAHEWVKAQATDRLAAIARDDERERSERGKREDAHHERAEDRAQDGAAEESGGPGHGGGALD